MQASYWVKLGILTLSILLFSGCVMKDYDAIRQDRLGAIDSFPLVKWSALNSTYTLNRWSASGGFLGIIGGISAEGGDERVVERRVVVAAQIPKDATIVILELKPDMIRLKYGDPPNIQFIYRADKIEANWYRWAYRLRLKELLLDDVKEIVITLPQDQLDDYLAVMVK